jgi:hypothetical protein
MVSSPSDHVLFSPLMNRLINRSSGYPSKIFYFGRKWVTPRFHNFVFVSWIFAALGLTAKTLVMLKELEVSSWQRNDKIKKYKPCG